MPVSSRQGPLNLENNRERLGAKTEAGRPDVVDPVPLELELRGLIRVFDGLCSDDDLALLLAAVRLVQIGSGHLRFRSHDLAHCAFILSD